MTNLEKDAQQIAAHIVNGDIHAAEDLFSRRLDGLKHFEAVVFREKIHQAVEAIEKRRRP